MKETDKKLYLVIGIAIALILFLAWQDTVGLQMWSSLGGFASEAYAKAEPFYLQQFWSFAYVIGCVMALIYYIFRRDVSEAASILLSYIFLLLAGLEDVLYFIIQRIPIPDKLPWLDNTIVMGTVAKVMGLPGVTPTSLWISVGLGVIVVGIMTYYLKGINFNFAGIKI